MLASAAIMKCFTLTRNSFAFILIAQFITGVAFNFTYNVAPVLAAKWFRNNEASFVIGATTCTVYIGNAISYAQPLIFEKAQTEEQIKSILLKMKIGMAVLSILCMALVISFMKNRPPQPANIAEARRSEMKNSSNSLTQLFRNKNFLLAALNVFISNTASDSCNILLNQIFSKDYADATAFTTITGLVYNVSAIIGSLVLPLILDKTKRYQLLIFWTYSIAFIFSLLFMTALFFKLNYLIHLFIFLFGACLYGQSVMMFDLIIELTYPFPQGTSVGLITGLSYITNMCFVPFLSWIIEASNILYAICVFESLLLIGFLPLFFISYKLLRNEAEMNDAQTTKVECEEL
ncbi:putative MFS-type transporter C09D4.1-like isoform X1 [Dinothrombium tinctorium]|uniref:Putative MFS-type transporter C09D4.1-like isoform X1 n=1 Tax=Dinothrombium tinctorium TaxID=1965070 RepID=A0A443R4B3_9ACAR|nr:putative MFS-type transporter C09D4.1-like isoform X1 [Dinothrombium tinctorium]